MLHSIDRILLHVIWKFISQQVRAHSWVMRRGEAQVARKCELVGMQQRLIILVSVTHPACTLHPSWYVAKPSRQMFRKRTQEKRVRPC